MERYFIGNSSQIEAKVNGVIKVRDLLTEIMSKDVSVALIELDGRNREIVNHKSKAFYFVLSGEGFFNIAGNDHYVQEGDFVLIEPGTPYFDRGKMNLLSVCSPRYDQASVEHLD